MSDTQQTPATQAPATGPDGQGEQQGQTFTQADVDRIVRERVKREREKYADYDDLKAKAGEKATVEDRLAAMEKRAADAEAKALRSDIAAEFGISAEDRDLFLSGSDEESLRAQAKRLADRESGQKKRSNYMPGEGNNPRPADSDDRQLVRQLFGRE